MRLLPDRVSGTATRRGFIRFVLLLLFFVVVFVASARAEGINLAWDDCGTHGTTLKSFACDSSVGRPFTMVASFVPPPNVGQYLGLSAEIAVSAVHLPDWWKFGTGFCRGGSSLSTNFDFTQGPYNCSDFDAGQAVGGYDYQVGYHSPDRARFRIQSAVPFDNRGPVDPAAEYYAFKAVILRNGSAGAGACEGCDAPVTIHLESIQLFQPPEVAYDPTITEPQNSATIYWQGSQGGIPSVASITPTSGTPGTEVTVRGQGFDGVGVVRFGGADAAFTVRSSSELATVVPQDVLNGPVEVINAFGSGFSASFTGPPRITGFVPFGGNPGVLVTILGHNFDPTSAVAFGGVAGAFSVQSDSMIVATVPAGAPTGRISVTNTVATATSGDDFHTDVGSGGIDLSWNDCGSAGDAVVQFACDANNTTTFPLVASFVPPAGVDHLMAIQADVEVSAPVLPDWWKHGPDGCRFTNGLNASMDFRGSSHLCQDAWQGRAVPGLQFAIGHYGANTALIRITGGLPTGSVVAVDPFHEYYAFRINLFTSKATGAGACAGCDVPVTLTLNNLKLLQPAQYGYDPVMTTPQHRNLAYWQSLPGDAPQITSFAPRAGTAGTVIAVTGRHFDGTVQARIGGRVASFASVTDSTLSVTTPGDPLTGPVFVRTLRGTAVSDSLFFAPAAILAFVPAQAPIGASVELHGYNFTRASAVAFAGKPATFTAESDTTLRAVVPAGAAAGRVTVTNPAGAGTSGADFRIGVTPPWVQSFAPPSGPPGTAVQVRGRWFTGATRVAFGDSAAVFTVVSDSLIRTTVPRGAVMAAISVTNPGGTGASDAAFVVTPGAPTIADFSPRSGPPQTSVAIVGTGFQNTTRVTFGGIDAPFFYGDDAHLTAIVPNGAPSGAIVVQTPSGYGASASAFLVEYPPVSIAQFSPALGSEGTPVTITGSGFVGTTAVTFDGVPAPSFTVLDPTQLRVTVPHGARSGALSVTTPAGTATSATTFTAPPVIASLLPTRGVAGDAVAIEGYNFAGVTSVTFTGVAATYVVSSDSTLATTVPAGALSGPVTISNPAGTSLPGVPFTVLAQHEGALDLSWNDCGSFGQEVQPFACNLASGSPATLVASFVPPSGVSAFLGTSATLEIRSSTATLPDWWKHGASECRGTNGLAVGFDFTSGPFACVDVMHGHAAGGFAYDVGYGGPDRARLRVQYAIPFDDRQPLDPAKEYYAFKVMVLHGGSSCSGCDVPVTITLQNLQLFQPPELGYDPVITGAAVRNSVAWQQAAPAGDLGPNLVRNGSFESALDGWGALYGARLERISGGHDGVFAMRAAAPDTSEDFGISDSPNTVLATPVAGLRYRFGAWVRTDQSSVRIRAREYVGRTRVQTVDSDNGNGATWQHLEGEITARQAGTTLDFQVVAYGVPGGSFVVDGITVQTVGAGPVITAPALASATVGSPVEVRVTVSNPGGQPLQGLAADLASLPTGSDATFTPSPDFTSGLLRWTPQVEDGGATYPLQFRALGEREAVQTTGIQVAPVSYGNYVSNPSFESWSDRWKPVGGGTVDYVPGGRTGYWSLLATGRADSTREFGINDSPNWIVSTPVAGMSFRIACWVRGEAVEGAVRLMVREYLNGAKVGATTLSPDLELGTGWQKVVVDRVAGVQGATLDVQLLGEPRRPGSRFWVDDMSIRTLNTALAPGVFASRLTGDSTAARPALFPNPLRDRATLSLAVTRAGPLRVALYDVNGRRVRTLFDRPATDPGEYRFEVSRDGTRGERLGPGIFFYKIESADGGRQGRFVILE